MKRFLSLIIIVVGCSNPMLSDVDVFNPQINIVPNLTQDSNSYYHLFVDRNQYQTLHKISLQTNYKKSTRIEWYANNSWVYNFGGFSFDVPIINGVSYTSVDGSAQTMFAPVIELVGDTVVVIATSSVNADTVCIILD